MEKVCSRCKENKSIENYCKRKDSKDGYQGLCKKCRNGDSKKSKINKIYTTEEIILEKIRRRNYYLDNKDNILIKCKEFRENNKDYTKSYKKIYYSKNRESLIKYSSEYHLSRLKNDDLYKFKCNVRSLIKNSTKYKGLTCKMNTKTFDILGCSIEDFKSYIELKFENWMSWENYGLYNGELNYGWDIDHIIPISSSKNEYDIIKLNHYTNLQPLCGYINRNIKKDKLDYK